MNTGIKNKLKELIGEEVSLFMGENISIIYPPCKGSLTYKILRIEDEDCVVLSSENGVMFQSIDHIKYIHIGKE